MESTQSKAQHSTGKESKDKDSLHERESSRSGDALVEKSFILRPDANEFTLFLTQVHALISAENKFRSKNPFAWVPLPKSTFESDMKGLCYSCPDESKKRILYEVLNVNRQNMNWVNYVLIGIKYTIRTTAKRRVDSHFRFTKMMLNKPNELVSSASDGSLSKPINEFLRVAEMAGGAR